MYTCKYSYNKGSYSGKLVVFHSMLITLHGVSGKTERRQIDRLIERTQVEMAELESMQKTITQVAIQAATAAVMALKEEDRGLTTGTNMTNEGKVHKLRHERPEIQTTAITLL